MLSRSHGDGVRSPEVRTDPERRETGESRKQTCRSRKGNRKRAFLTEGGDEKRHEQQLQRLRSHDEALPVGAAAASV